MSHKKKKQTVNMAGMMSEDQAFTAYQQHSVVRTETYHKGGEPKFAGSDLLSGQSLPRAQYTDLQIKNLLQQFGCVFLRGTCLCIDSVIEGHNS